MTRVEAKREAELNTWIIKKFRKIRADEVRNEQKRIERQKEKHKYVFENYHNRQQIEDDYGYDAITLRQYREYLRIWDDVHEDNTKYEDRLRFIDRQIRTSQSNLEEMKLIMKNGDPYDGRR